MTDETIERVAKAIAVAMCRNWDDPKTQRELYRMQARAAIAAIPQQEVSAKALEREARRQKSLVGLAYSEGVLDVSARSAAVDNSEEKFSTSDAKAASDDPLTHQLEWPDHYEASALSNAEVET